MATSALVIGLLATPTAGISERGDFPEAPHGNTAVESLGAKPRPRSEMPASSGANGVAQAGRAPDGSSASEVGGSNPFRLVAPEHSEREQVSEWLPTSTEVLGVWPTHRRASKQSGALVTSSVSRSEQTAGSSVLPTALNPAPQAQRLFLLRQEGPSLGANPPRERSEVALGSGGEAYFRSGETPVTGFLLSLSHAKGVRLGIAHYGARERAKRLGLSATSCSARKAVAFYQARVRYWAHKMGAVAPRARTTASEGARPAKNRPRQFEPAACPRYLARVFRAKAHAARVRYEAWREYNFHWQAWLPAKHQRVAACETGHQGGSGPGGSRWDWDSGSYVSAFGIYRDGYADDAHRIGNLSWDETIRRLGRLPTPREQMQAVDSHRAAHGGWSGWGCRGA